MKARQKKNFIFITFDQLRGDWHGSKWNSLNMPNLEMTSRGGIHIRRCYTSSPQCIPARLSWLTGEKPSRYGITRNTGIKITNDIKSLYRNLSSSGWKTILIGKTHWTNHQKPHDLRENTKLLEDLGFNTAIECAGPRAMQRVKCKLTDQWINEGVYDEHIKDLEDRYKNGRNRKAWQVKQTTLPNHLYPDIWICNESIKQLQALPTNEPWFLWVSFVGPHEPFDTPPPWKGKNKELKENSAVPEQEWIKNLNKSYELKKTWQSWDGKLKDEEIMEARKDYLDHCALLDDQIGRIIAALNQRNDSNNTDILITSDHGDMMGDHGMMYKSTFLEGSIRVPFIYRPANARFIWQRTTKIEEAPLTGAIKIILKGLQKAKTTREVARNLRELSKKPIVIEYGDEIMMIKDGIKAAFKGNTAVPIWCTDIKRDRNETINIIEKGPNSRQKAILRILKKNARRLLRSKMKRSWIIADLRD
tara:strand:+ start:3051 stop:4475 length:1425 start_codon:yes stop_codon:yes gene_type:complete